MSTEEESLTPAQRAKLIEELKQRLKEIEELKAALQLNTPEGMPPAPTEEAQPPSAQKAREAVEELRVPPLEMLVDRPDSKKKKQPEMST